MVQAYGFTPKDSTTTSDVFQHTGESDEHHLNDRLTIVACFFTDNTLH